MVMGGGGGRIRTDYSGAHFNENFAVMSCVFCCIVVIRPRVPTYCQQINCDMARGVWHSEFRIRPPTLPAASPATLPRSAGS